MVRVAALSDIGCRRANNEDSYGYDEDSSLYVVSDGMGGSAAGEVASHLAVQTILASFRRMRSKTPPSALQELLYYAVLQANTVVHQHADQNPRCAGMGATLVALCLDGTNGVIANVGDSRAYLLRADDCVAITQDHSLGAEQMRMGLIPPGGENDPSFNLMTRAIGMEAQVQPDLFTVQLLAGDRILLASDGLMKHLSDTEIGEIVNANKILEEACDALIQAVKLDGAKDNVTCLLIEI